MKRLKPLGLTALSVLALSAVAVGSASAALPTVSALPGEAMGKIVATGSATGTSIAGLSTALLPPIPAEKVELEASFESGASKGTYEAKFVAVEFEGEQCNTPGDPDGVMLVPGVVHLVDSSGSVPAAAFLIASTVLMECGPLAKPMEVLKITGGVIGKLVGISNGTELTSFKLNLKCTKAGNGKQEVKELINGEGKAVKVVLSANLGLGAESGCEEVKEEVTLNFNKMATFMGF
jgi:hypothetical protein